MGGGGGMRVVCSVKHAAFRNDEDKRTRVCVRVNARAARACPCTCLSLFLRESLTISKSSMLPCTTSSNASCEQRFIAFGGIFFLRLIRLGCRSFRRFFDFCACDVLCRSPDHGFGLPYRLVS